MCERVEGWGGAPTPGRRLLAAPRSGRRSAAVEAVLVDAFEQDGGRDLQRMRHLHDSREPRISNAPLEPADLGRMQRRHTAQGLLREAELHPSCTEVAGEAPAWLCVNAHDCIVLSAEKRRKLRTGGWGHSASISTRSIA